MAVLLISARHECQRTGASSDGFLGAVKPAELILVRMKMF